MPSLRRKILYHLLPMYRLLVTPLGKRGERYASRHLERQGYGILANNWHWHRRELDIVACRGHDLVAIEVKTRIKNVHYTIESNVRQRQAERILSLIAKFKERHPSKCRRLQLWNVRGDLILIQACPRHWGAPKLKVAAHYRNYF